MLLLKFHSEIIITICPIWNTAHCFFRENLGTWRIMLRLRRLTLRICREVAHHITTHWCLRSSKAMICRRRTWLMDKPNQWLLSARSRRRWWWLLRLSWELRARVVHRISQVRIGDWISIWSCVRILRHFPFAHRSGRMINMVLLAPYLCRINETIDRWKVVLALILLVGEAGAIINLFQESLSCWWREWHPDRLLLRALA